MASKKDFYLPKALQIGMGSYYSFNGPSSTLSCDSQWNNRSVFSFQSRVYGWVQFGHEPDQYSPIIFLYHLWTCFLKHASPCCTLHNIQGRRYMMKPKSLFMVIQHFAVCTVLVYKCLFSHGEKTLHEKSPICCWCKSKRGSLGSHNTEYIGGGVVKLMLLLCSLSPEVDYIDDFVSFSTFLPGSMCATYYVPVTKKKLSLPIKSWQSIRRQWPMGWWRTSNLW